MQEKEMRGGRSKDTAYFFHLTHYNGRTSHMHLFNAERSEGKVTTWKLYFKNISDVSCEGRGCSSNGFAAVFNGSDATILFSVYHTIFGPFLNTFFHKSTESSVLILNTKSHSINLFTLLEFDRRHTNKLIDDHRHTRIPTSFIFLEVSPWLYAKAIPVSIETFLWFITMKTT